LPNDPLVFELTGFIARRQGRCEESTTDLKRALELDPRNLFFLQQLSLTYSSNAVIETSLQFWIGRSN